MKCYPNIYKVQALHDGRTLWSSSVESPQPNHAQPLIRSIKILKRKLEMKIDLLFDNRKFSGFIFPLFSPAKYSSQEAAS